MSTVVDEKVVSMRFDNKHFESNVQTSMSTLDKLKQKLRLTEATKGLENIGSAARKVNLSGISDATDTVGLKFNAMYTIADQAFRNITNSAMAYGKKIISAFTIDPVKTGFQEYETQINAVQTILANTESKGTTLDDVNAALDELNTYADKTIYNFTEMTKNIGTFTAAGIDLDTSVKAIQGIANLAAVSGSTSQQASTAMYQLSQALAAGTVKLTDWNSVVTAGMGGQLFQDVLKETAKIRGVDIDGLIEKYGSFRNTLSTGWITTDIMTESLEKFTMSTEGLTEAEIKANREKLKSIGYTDEQIDSIFKLGNTATDAATKVKTFTQLFDTLKEAAQSGWTQTWEIIVGDFEESKALFTGISNFIGGLIGGVADWRNTILEFALNFAAPWTSITEKIGTIKDAVKTVGDLTDKLEYYQDVVTRVWRGDYNNQGDNPDRRDLLRGDGYNEKVVQDLVNKGYLYKLTVEDIEASYKKFGLTVDTSTTTTKKATAALTELTEEQLRSLGLTEDEIDLYKALAKEADRLGISIEDLATRMSENNGRSLLIDTVKNFADIFIGIGKAIKDAWVDIFDPPGVGEIAVRLYGIIAAINEFSKSLRLTNPETGELNENGEKFKRIFKGVFALIDIITTIIGGPLKIALKAVTSLLKYFNLDILTALAYVGDAAVGFRDWMDSVLDFTKVFEIIIPVLKNAGSAVYGWVQSLKDVDNIPQYIIQGLVNGLKNGVKAVGDAIWNIGTTIINKAKEVFDINSPSVVFMTIGGFIISGLIYGIRNGFPELLNLVKNIFTSIIEYVSTVDFGTLLVAALGIGTMITVSKVANVFASVLEPIGDMFEGLGAYLKGAAWEKRSKALLNMAIAIGILIAAIVVLSKVNTDNVWESIGIIGALAGILLALAIATSKLSSASATISKDGVKMNSLTSGLLGIAGALLIIAFTVKLIGNIEEDKAKRGFNGLINILGALLVFTAVCGKVINAETMANINKLGGVFIKLGISLLLMQFVIKTAAKLDESELRRGLGVVAALEAFILAVAFVARLAGANADKAGALLLKMSVAMLIMVAVVKMASKLDPEDVRKGLTFVGSVSALFGAIIALSLLSGANADKAGSLILKMSVSMLIMIAVVKLIATVSSEDLLRALAVVTTLELLFAAIIGISYFAGEHADKVGGMLLKMSIALLVLTGVIFLLGLMEPDKVNRALGVIVILEACFAGLIAVTKIAQGSKEMMSVLIVLTVAIALLVGAVVGLSFIDPERLKGATLAMVSIMGMLAVMIAVTKLAGQIKIGSILMLTAMALPLLAFSLVLRQMNGVQDAIKNAIALIGVAAAMALLLIPLTAIGSMAGQAILGVLMLTAMAVPLLAFSLVLRQMNGVQNAAKNALVLIGIATVMTLLLIPLTVIGLLAGAAILGVIALTTMAVPLFAFVKILEMMQGIQNAEANSKLLIAMMTAFGDVLFKISLVAPLAVIAVAAITALVSVLTAVGVLATAIGALMTAVPQLQDFLNKGIPIMEQLALGIGTMVGNLIAGFATAIFESLPNLGLCLSKFIVNATPFIIGIKMVDDKVLTGVKNIAAAVLLLTAADLISGIASIVQGGSSFSDLGKDLSKFMKNMAPFIEGATQFTSEITNGVKNIADAILVLTGASILEGIASLITGESSLDKFSTELPKLGAGIRGFIDAVGTIDEGQMASVKLAAECVKTLASAAAEIPNTGGLLGDLVGNNDMGPWAEQMEPLAQGIVKFIATVAGVTINDTGVEMVKKAAEIVEVLATAASKIPNTGGLLADLVGDNDMQTWAGKMEPLAQGIVKFIATVAAVTITSTGVDMAKRSAEIIEVLAKAAAAIPNTGGLLADLVGDNDMETWASKLPKLGEGVAGFVDKTKDLNESQVASVQVAVNMISALTSLAEANLKDAAKNLPDFGTSMEEFGAQIASFGWKLTKDIPSENLESAVDNAEKVTTAVSNAANNSNVRDNLTTIGARIEEFGAQIASFGWKLTNDITTEKVDEAVSNAQKVIDFANDAPEVDATKLSTFGSALAAMAENGIKAFVDALYADGVGAAISKSAAYIIGTFTKKLVEKTTDIETAFSDVASSGASVMATKDLYTEYYDAGSYLVDGFAAGISENDYKAEAKAAAMASAALAAAKEELDEHSPSREAYKVGDFFGVGFINGVADNIRGAFLASSDMASSAKNGLGDAIGKVKDLIDSGMDTQPTIRPVLDLSDVRSGVKTMGSMLYGNRTLSIGTDSVGVISASMSGIQNGKDNSELVSAIKGLREDLANSSGDIYNVNGITYDDGSNVVNAVKDLVRAVKIERRV